MRVPLCLRYLWDFGDWFATQTHGAQAKLRRVGFVWQRLPQNTNFTKFRLKNPQTDRNKPQPLNPLRFPSCSGVCRRISTSYSDESSGPRGLHQISTPLCLYIYIYIYIYIYTCMHMYVCKYKLNIYVYCVSSTSVDRPCKSGTQTLLWFRV